MPLSATLRWSSLLWQTLSPSVQVLDRLSQTLNRTANQRLSLQPISNQSPPLNPSLSNHIPPLRNHFNRHPPSIYAQTHPQTYINPLLYPTSTQCVSKKHPKNNSTDSVFFPSPPTPLQSETTLIAIHHQSTPNLTLKPIPILSSMQPPSNASTKKHPKTHRLYDWKHLFRASLPQPTSMELSASL